MIHRSSARLLVLLCLLWSVMLAAQGTAPRKAPKALIVDTSDSMKKFDGAVKKDVLAFLASQPDETRIRITGVDAGTHAIFSGVLDFHTRKEAANEIDQITFTTPYTDLAAGLVDAQSWLQRVGTGGENGLILIFTDGRPWPPKNSKFTKRSFGSLLNDALLVPESRQLMVRLYAPAPDLHVDRHNIRILEGDVHFGDLFRPAPPPAPHPVVEARPRWNWWLAIGVSTLLLLLWAVGAHRSLQEWWRARLLAKETEEMQAPVEPIPAPLVVAPMARLLTRFSVRSAGEEVIADRGRPRVLVGNLVQADLYLTQCSGAVLLELQETDGQLFAENVGEETIRIGRRPLDPAAGTLLPQGRIEIGLGAMTVVVRTETYYEKRTEAEEALATTMPVAAASAGVSVGNKGGKHVL
jgi:hypothetical protein